MSTLGKNIVKIRVDKGLKQKDLITEVRLSQRYVSAIENDNVDPRLSIVLRIAAALDVTPAMLLEDLRYEA